MFVEGSGEKSPRQLIADRIRKANAFFARADVKEAIQASSEETLRWLKDNRHTFENHTEVLKPWWPELPPTEDVELADARDRMIASSAHEFGTRKQCQLLVATRLGFPEDYPGLKKAVDHRAIAVHFQLVAFDRVGHPALKLHEMAKRFDYKAPAKLRDRMLAQMAELGIWHTEPGVADYEAYAISIGPVAKAFHTNALFPAIQYFTEQARKERVRS